MTTEEVQSQVAVWRATNQANLVDCPISFTISRRACRKRRERLERLQFPRGGPGDRTCISSHTCAACETLFDNDD
ncbi:MAG: hypothetical protein RDU20_21670 [Desulfomonilaceae bacterium]|nr:hypothetical protein [Desulfomonilaceae bacterium]